MKKSNIISEKLYNLGYKMYQFMQEGLPEWKKAGLATTVGAKKTEDKPKKKKQSSVKRC